MQKRILVIYPSVGECTGTPAGSDVHILASYLEKEYDVNVDVISSSPEQHDSVRQYNHIFIPTYKYLYSTYVEKYEKKQNIFSKIFNRIMLKFAHYKYEGSSFAREIMSFEHLERWVKHNKKEKYGLVISVSNPFYVHKYAKYVMDNMKIKQWCAVFLDPHADGIYANSKNREKKISEENKIFENCTSIFAVKEFVDNSVNSNVKKYKEKISIVPVHIIDDKTGELNKALKNDGTIKCVFAGRFYEDIRNPEIMLECFQRLPSNYRLYLYSMGCQNTVAKHKSILGDRLIYTDFIYNQQDYDRMMGSMDIFIDLGNTIENQVPSKVFDYASYGVPILHFSNCKNDPVENLLSEYPLFASIPYTGDIENILYEIVNFCEKAKGKTVPWEKIKNIFETNTVEYVSKKVIDLID